MCTVTWRSFPGGFELVTNRDERRTRGRALPPAVRTIDGTQVIAPSDADAGGAWVAVSEHGLALALVNRYDPMDEPAEGWTSRGQLVLDLATAPTDTELIRRLDAAALRLVRPFAIVVLSPDRPAVFAEWDGRQRRIGATRPPLVSSSVQPDTASRTRTALLEAIDNLTAGPSTALLAFHASHDPRRGPLSVCMHRPDASTVSLSRILVDPERASLAYADGPPCETPLGPPVVLPRRAAPRVGSATEPTRGR